MDLNSSLILHIIFSVVSILIISLAIGKIINTYTKLNVIFYFPLGFLAFLGFSYFLSYPFVLLQLQVSLYNIILGIMYVLCLIWSIYLIYKNKKSIKVEKTKIFLILLGIVFIVVGIIITSRYTFGKVGFDSMFYLTGVTNNIDSSILGHFDNQAARIASTFNVQYSFSSYYYIQSFFIRISTLFFPLESEIMIAPLYIWQSTIVFMALSVFTFINLLKMIKNKWAVIASVVIIILFFGTMYYNTALAFLGNSQRIQIAANLFLVSYLMFKKKKTSNQEIFLLTLIMGALISVSRSGFFIGAFFVYGLFYALIVKRVGFVIFKYMLVSLPIFMYLFIYIGINPFLPTIIIGIILYLLSKVKMKKSLEEIIFKLINYLMLVIPILIIVYVLLNYKFFEYGMDYFFYQHATHDMGWDYFYFSSNLLVNLANVIFIIVLFTSIFIKRKSRVIDNILLIILLTFLNPLVIPFTAKYFTSYAFNRSFDILFNPFVIVYGLGTLYQIINKKFIQIGIMCVVVVVFTLLSYRNLTSYYTNVFLPTDSKNFNSVYRLDQNKVDVLYELEQYLQEDRKIITQIDETRAYISNLDLIQTFEFLRNYNNTTGYTEDQINLLNIMLLREYVTEDYIDDQAPQWWRVCPLLEGEEINTVVIKEESFFLTDEGVYISLGQTLRNCGWTEVYKNDIYIILKSNR